MTNGATQDKTPRTSGPGTINPAHSPQITDHEMLRCIGSGSYGEVWLARNVMSTYRAVKVVYRQTFEHEHSYEREFKGIKKFEPVSRSHDGLVDILQVGRNDHAGYYYYVMELGDDLVLGNQIIPETYNPKTLGKEAAARGKLPVDECVKLGLSLAAALSHLHQHGLIHRDIKPSNIMIDPSDTPRITDFGIAQMAEHTAKLSVSGTPSYMSPEQVREGVAQKESDLFSLGCVLYELLSGKKAFVGDNFFAIMYKIVHDDPVPLSKLRPDLPLAVIEAVQKAMAKDLSERFQTGMDLAYHLRLAIQGLEEPLRKEKNVIDQIHHIPFFQNFNRDQVRELVQTASIVRIRRGGTIVAEGEIDDTFYVLLNGRALVMKEGRSLADIVAGECFGEMAYITKQARSADVVAFTDCILMKISATLLNRSSESIQLLFFKNFALTLVRRLNQKSDKKD
jgi:serine/threonine-protein kinase